MSCSSTIIIGQPNRVMCPTFINIAQGPPIPRGSPFEEWPVHLPGHLLQGSHHEPTSISSFMSQGLCCRCLEAIFKQNKTHSSMWDPDGHTLSFRSSWWRLDVEVVGFFDGKKTWWEFWKQQLCSSKNSLLSKQNPMTYPWDWYIFLPTWKPWKSTIHAGIPYYGLYGIVSPPPKKKKWKVQPAQPRKKLICVDPFLSYLLVSARHLFWPKKRYLGSRRGVIFWKPRQTPYIGDKLIPLLMTGTLIMGL